MTIFIDRAADLSDLMSRANRMHSPLAALLPPIAAGRLTLALVLKRDACISMRQLRAIATPVLALIGDDDATPTGPAGWISSSNLLRWSEGAMIHAAAGEHDHYRAAATGAQIVGRLVMVETSSAYLAAWVAAAGDKARLVIKPRGGTHPVYPSRSEMH